jgi:Spy/CpxP family protein refolding chaperone
MACLFNSKEEHDMKRSKKILISTTAALILGAASASMVSAKGHGCDGGYGSWQQGQGQEQTQQDRSERMKQKMEDRLGYAKYKLGITEQQEPAWQEFTKSLDTKFTAKRDRKEKRGEKATVTDRVKMMREHAERMTKMADAIEKLYAALTPEQQKLADQLRPMGMHGRF